VRHDQRGSHVIYVCASRAQCFPSMHFGGGSALFSASFVAPPATLPLPRPLPRSDSLVEVLFHLFLLIFLFCWFSIYRSASPWRRGEQAWEARCRRHTSLCVSLKGIPASEVSPRVVMHPFFFAVIACFAALMCGQGVNRRRTTACVCVCVRVSSRKRSCRVTPRVPVTDGSPSTTRWMG
jgi:hypothetical protein